MAQKKQYKEEDLISQKIFGIEYFTWLDFWEQHHIVTKYKLENVKITK